jgi:hypothetical protein
MPPDAVPPDAASDIDPNNPWPPPPDEMLKMMMFARFSMLDEPAGEQNVQGADRGGSPAGAPPPQPQAQAQPQG